MADIFVSYARSDRHLTARIVNLLEHHGWSVWWDTRIDVGETWDAVIEREIGIATCIVVIWSPTSVNSRWVRVEALEGLERKILVPIVINGAQPPLAFKLVQSIDFAQWTGTEGDNVSALLVDAVRRTIGTPVRPRGVECSARIEGASSPKLRASAATELALKLVSQRLSAKQLDHLLHRPDWQYGVILRQIAESVGSSTEIRPRWQTHLEGSLSKAVEIVDLAVDNLNCDASVYGLSPEQRGTFLAEIWRHRDMSRWFREGQESSEAFSVHKEGLAGVAGQYLTQTGRSAELERVLVDAMVAEELRAFGVEIKKWPQQFDRRSMRWNSLEKMTEFAELYDKAKGNLAEMSKAADKRNLQKAGNKLAVWIGLPALLILLGVMGNNNALLRLGIGAIIVVIAFSVLAGLTRPFRKRQPGLERASELWKKMRQAYDSLDGGTISPQRVREELLKSSAEGAGWNSEVFAILDEAVARSPGIWK
jgi:hypothetical protein